MERSRGGLQEDVGDRLRVALWLLYGAVGLVLLIACANVSNLLLVRSASRSTELAVRAALGAGRRRLFAQLLSEALLLGLVGGGLGVLVALGGMRGLHAWLVATPSLALLADGVRLDARVLVHAAAASLGCAVAFGLLPAVRVSRADLNVALWQGGRHSGGGGDRRRVQSALVVSQVAIALVLLTTTGVFLRALADVRSADRHFDPSNLLTLRTTLSAVRYDGDPETARFFEATIETLEEQPGVLSAAATTRLPTAVDSQPNAALALPGTAGATGDPPTPSVIEVHATPGYLATVRIPLLRGRALEPTDTAAAIPVAVVSHALVERLWPAGDVIGQQIRVGQSSDEPWLTVVGVVEDIPVEGLDLAPTPHVYRSFLQSPRRDATLVLRTRSAPEGFELLARRAVRQVDPRQPVYEVKSGTAIVDENRSSDDFLIGLLTLLGGVALALAATGVYAVVSQSVQQRRYEIGVRVALGAAPTGVVLLVVRRGAAMISTGLVVGSLGAAAIVRLLGSQIEGLAERDAAGPATFVAAALVLATVALAASYLPARRATRIDPTQVLREG